MKIIILLFIGIVTIEICNGANLRRLFRMKRAESDFILRSCIATAQLTRKHRINDASRLVVEETNLPYLASASLKLDNSKFKGPNSIKHLRSGSRFKSKSKGRNLILKKIDSPLGTVDVQPIRQDFPKAFKKKDPLPELDRRGSARNLDTDTPITVVHTLKPKIM
ncbi:uncharacterized protein LOC106653906 [Trichogramma pretiosum]|uniref:uncharacterized protein LOC106653906 n=1 Tax=Trichogramma pretiosum TaxID=7493 RepID=UPI0006C9CB14|nr:uncharacterized protein LOC106653906 [Trichogramma pretiosum]XP_014229044.1 uncharacterized protein LOC106653906 [Trichogramma pretiosum]XP_023318430.1 uncharacterized protein LOC106653906 [Trichogramma pretiosum]